MVHNPAMTSRRSFLQASGLAAAALCSRSSDTAGLSRPLQEFVYENVELAPVNDQRYLSRPFGAINDEYYNTYVKVV